MSDSVVDPRHQKRMKLMQILFAKGFNDLIGQERIDQNGASLNVEYDEIIDQVLAEKEKLDQLVISVAPERPVSEIN